jgi:acyl dehydratase
MAELSVGQALPRHVIDPVQVGPMKVVAALLDDPVPLHFNVEEVKALGMGDRLINQGPLGAAYLLEMAIRFAGDAARVRRAAVRLLGTVRAGDRIVCTGVVSEIDRTAGIATLELAAEVDSTPVLAATVAIELD